MSRLSLFSPSIIRLLLFAGMLSFLLQWVCSIIVNGDPLSLSVFSIIGGPAVLWFVVRGSKISIYLLLILLCWVIVEWLYRYGEVGFGFYLLTLFTLLHQRIWKREAGEVRNRTERAIVLFFFLCMVFALRDLLIVCLGIEARLFSIEGAEALIGANELMCKGFFLWVFFRFVMRFREEDGNTNDAGNFSRSVFLLGTLSAYVFFSNVQSHEYYYFFAGAPPYVLHPGFAGACAVILSFLGVFLVWYAGKAKTRTSALFLLALFFVVWMFPPPVVVPSAWSVDNPRTLLSQFNVAEWIGGQGILWREKVREVLSLGTLYKVNQFPLGEYPSLVLLGGIPLLLSFISVFLVSLVEAKGGLGKVFFFRAVIVVLFVSAVWVPGATNPMALCFFALFLGWGLTRRQVDSSYVGAEVEKLLSRVAGTVITCVLSVILFIGMVAGVKIARGPRVPVPSEKLAVAATLVKHVLIAEDFLFFVHPGVDFARLKWTLRDTLREKKFVRGGSTVSMQLAKMLYLTYEKTLSRKIQQVFLALYLEQVMTKEEILHLYLVALDFGIGPGGVENASEHFFGKSADSLTKEESLRLTLSIPDPVAFNPAMRHLPKSIREKRSAVSSRTEKIGGTLEPHIAALSFVK